MKQHNYRNLSD